MAKEREIVVDIFDNGTTKIEAFGFEGDSCLKETESLEEALGKVTERKRKQGEKVSIGDKTKVGH